MRGSQKRRVYLAKLFIQILYNQARVHRVRPCVTQRGGHVTAIILVRFSVCAVNVLESGVSIGTPRTKETSCDLIRDDHLDKRQKLFKQDVTI